MISNQEHEDVWTFLDSMGRAVRVNVVVIDYPGDQSRSAFVTGIVVDGRIVYCENGKYVCDDGEELQLPTP